MINYCVIVRLNGEVMGSKEGIPCHSLKQAKTLAASYRKRDAKFEMTEVVVAHKGIRP